MSEELPEYEIKSLKSSIISNLKLNGLACADCLSEHSLDELREIAREYYKNSVIGLDVWRVVNKPKDSMKFNDAFYNHLWFIDELKYMLSQGCMLMKANVVSTHMSKSITLPVIMFEKCQVKIYMRYNFHDWTVSVDSPYDLDISDMLASSCHVENIYCQGFKDEWKFGNYDSSRSKFTLSLPSDYYMFTFIYLLNQAIAKVTIKTLKANKKRRDPAPGDVYTSDIGGSPIQIISVIEGVANYSGTTFMGNSEIMHKPIVEFSVYVIDGDTITTRRLTYDELHYNYTKSNSPRIFK